MYNYKIIDSLCLLWEKSGLKKGDLLILHSDIRRTVKYYLTKKIKITPEDIFYSFLKVIGEEGTILFPCFNTKLSTEMTFDIKRSRSRMGNLSEIARNFNGSFRTSHPIYSFSIIGKKKNLFYNCDDFTGIGSNSPFDVMYKNDGKIAVLNLPENDSMTFYHFVEMMHNVDYRHVIKFQVNYIDHNDDKTKKEYGYFARKRDEGIITDLEPMSKILWKKNFYKGDYFNKGHGLRIIKARDLYKETSKIILSGLAEGMLYKLENKIINF